MRTTTVVVVVVRTPHSVLKKDRTRTVIRTSKCAVQMTTNPQKLKKKNSKIFLNFFMLSTHHLNSTFRCAETVRVRSFLRILWGVWTTTTTTVVVRTLLWCGNSLGALESTVSSNKVQKSNVVQYTSTTLYFHSPIYAFF